MNRGGDRYFSPLAPPAEELDTPALVVDLGIMEQNIAVLHNVVSGSDDGSGAGRVAVRPHVSCHGCPEIARIQLSAAGSSGGVAVSSLAEAEAFAAADDGTASLSSGIDDVLIAGRVITAAKISRLVALAGRITLSVAVDNPRNVQDLAEAAHAAGVTVGVLVDMDAGYGFGGVASVQDAVDLAQTVAGAPGLSLKGIMTYEGPLAITDRSELEAESRRRLQPVLDARGALEQAGIEIATVSAGSTYNYDIVSQISGITEVQGRRVRSDGYGNPASAPGVAAGGQYSGHGHQPSGGEPGGGGRRSQDYRARFRCTRSGGVRGRRRLPVQRGARDTGLGRTGHRAVDAQ